MKISLMIAMAMALGFAAAAQQPKALTADPLTGQPLTPASISGFGTNEPTKMPDGHVCSSKMQGNFYMLFNATVDATVSWYDSHLSGFKKSQGKDRTQTAFYNSDGTTRAVRHGVRGPNGRL